MNPNDDVSWKTQHYRRDIISRVEDALQLSVLPKSILEMENQVFLKAKTKDEYLHYVNKLMNHMKESKLKPQNPNSLNPQTSSADPMNALRAMTGQPGNNQMMNIQQSIGPSQMNSASCLLQTLNRPRGPLQQSGMMGQMGAVPQNVMTQGQIPQNIMLGPLQQVSMQPGMMAQNTLPGNSSGGSMIGNQIGGSMMNHVPLGAGMPHGQMNVGMNQIPGPRKMVPEGMISGQNSMPFMSRGIPNQFLRQNTPPPNQTVPMNSLASTIQSPGGLMSSHSPTTPANTGGLVGSVMRPGGVSHTGDLGGPAWWPTLASFGSLNPLMRMVPSPSNISLNTPGGQSQPTPSPLSNSDEQAYQEKVRQLSKYIDPLRRMIQRSGSGDQEKTSKMKKLLEILTSQNLRITMDALLKCEAVLEKLDITTGLKEHHLIEAISTTLQSPNANHTFRRTFEPIMSTLSGKSLKNLQKPIKRKYVEETPSDIPEVLQGEVARLDQRFKVSLDPVHQNSSKCVYLVCWLDDRHLPCIPPIHITIPEHYPESSPKCDLSNYEYSSTKFLRMIQEALTSRISKLHPKYTMSQLLDTWENSVRETCSLDRISSHNEIQKSVGAQKA